MRNPWVKRNPLLSIWLSSANAVAGSVRGKATVAARREMKTMMRQANRQLSDAWVNALMPSLPRPRKRKQKQR